MVHGPDTFLPFLISEPSSSGFSVLLMSITGTYVSYWVGSPWAFGDALALGMESWSTWESVTPGALRA